MLEKERKDDSPGTFALELAFVVEEYGDATAEEAAKVLDLYLKGAKSLMLAVSYAQRATPHSTSLWQSLIDYCLTSKSKGTGAKFGLLLEAAALAGADLGHLVKQIPHGMAVEGLRPRLVSAVADYRLRLRMHEKASSVAFIEQKDLLREYSHRTLRGVRYAESRQQERGKAKYEKPSEILTTKATSSASSRPPVIRPRLRPTRYSAMVTLPIR